MSGGPAADGPSGSTGIPTGRRRFVPLPQQLVVIEHGIDTGNPVPLRVAAGAGTGKTTTMAHRLAHAIDVGMFGPEEALGVTFTNKAAEELADRIRELLPEAAREGRSVDVTTYHGFAHRILMEEGARVGVEREAQVVSAGYVRQLLHESLSVLEPGRLDLTQPQRPAGRAAALADQLSENLLTVDELLEAALDAADDVWRERLALADVVRAYDGAKRRLGVLDYGDLIRLAHRCVSDPIVAARIRDRYRLVLLDEYQDTNPAQRELLRLVFGDGFPVTAVGDADQTIYEWRGASIENFAAFPEHFRTAAGSFAPTRPLTVNLRSDRLILAVANRVRRELGGSIDTDLEPAADAGSGRVAVGVFRTAVDEARAIAGEIDRLHRDQDVAWRDMAVLVRRNASIGLVRDALAEAGIPSEVAALGGLLTVPEVAELHAWLRLLADPEHGPALVRVLLGSQFRLGIADLAPLVAWTRSRRADDVEPAGPGWPLLEAVDRIDEVGGLPDEARRRLTAFRTIYRELLTVAQGVTLVELCRRILDAIGAWHEVDAMEPAARLSTRLNLYRFLDLAEDWSPLHGRPSLDAFLGYLDLLIEEGTADELDTARVGGEDAVALLTVHRAKGLEWPVVFLPGVASTVFPARSLGYDDPTRFGHRVPFHLRLDAAVLPDPAVDDVGARLREMHAAQEWRTAYVAVTRAATALYVTTAWWSGSTVRPREPSELLHIVADVSGVERWVWTDDPGEAPGRLVIGDETAAPDPLFGRFDDTLREVVGTGEIPPGLLEAAGPRYADEMEQLRMILDGLPSPPAAQEAEQGVTTSVTGLVTYATCPLQYFWSEVEPLPRRPSSWLRRGVQVHRRIELHNKGVVPLDEAEPETYDWGPGDAVEPDEPGTPGAFDTFAASRYAEQRPLLVESPFRLRRPAATVRGRIDAVYPAGTDDGPRSGGWEVVDFKSGSAPDGVVGEARRLQLQSYALAVQDGVFGPAPEHVRVSFVYLGGDSAVTHSEAVDARWLETAGTAVDGVIDGIANEEFDPTPSPACRRCDFLSFCEPGRAHVARAARDAE